MRTLPLVLGLVVSILSSTSATVGCSESCFRHTDCSAGATCVDGVCLVVVEREATDAASVEPVTVESTSLAVTGTPEAGVPERTDAVGVP